MALEERSLQSISSKGAGRIRSWLKCRRRKERVVSIDAYRQSRTKGVGRLTSQILAGRLYAEFTWKDWSTLLAQLKTEISQIDRAILALTKLAMGRGQPILSQTDAPELKQGRR